MSLSRDAEVYFPPSEKEEEIYQQMAERKMCEIPRPLIKLQYKLGEGEFGVVYKGQWYSHTGNREVAVKVMRDGSTEKDKSKVLQEAVIMGQFSHQHVVQFYGILTLMEPVSVAGVHGNIQYNACNNLTYIDVWPNVEWGVCCEGRMCNIQICTYVYNVYMHICIL